MRLLSSRNRFTNGGRCLETNPRDYCGGTTAAPYSSAASWSQSAAYSAKLWRAMRSQGRARVEHLRLASARMAPGVRGREDHHTHRPRERASAGPHPTPSPTHDGGGDPRSPTGKPRRLDGHGGKNVVKVVYVPSKMAKTIAKYQSRRASFRAPPLTAKSKPLIIAAYKRSPACFFLFVRPLTTSI